jgi:translation elongation factor EF-1alpha
LQQHAPLQVGFRAKDVWYVPCSGLTGVNLVENKEPKLKAWYRGDALIDYIGVPAGSEPAFIKLGFYANIIAIRIC